MDEFWRSHGLGNDYLVLEAERLSFALSPRAIQRLCDRHRGPGGDGALVPGPARPGGAFGVWIYNPDGSQTEKSGNGLRIFAHWLWRQGRVGTSPFTIDVLGGKDRVTAQVHPGEPTEVTVEMGHASFRPADVPCTLPWPELVEVPLGVEGQEHRVTVVGLGNPHCVRFSEDPVDLAWWGPRVEHHRAFPNRVNVQVARVLGPGRLWAEIWERGAGITQASGSSACAVAAAAVRTGRASGPQWVEMPGGRLYVEVGEGYSLRQRGPVEESAHGVLGADLVRRLRSADQAAEQG